VRPPFPFQSHANDAVHMREPAGCSRVSWRVSRLIAIEAAHVASENPMAKEDRRA
jgi:hypothetical protein